MNIVKLLDKCQSDNKRLSQKAASVEKGLATLKTFITCPESLDLAQLNGLSHQHTIEMALSFMLGSRN